MERKMKKSVLFASTLGILLCSNAQAQNSDLTGAVEAGGQLGVMWFERDADLSHDLAAGARVGYYLTNEIEAEGSLLVSTPNVPGKKGQFNDGDATVFMPHAELAYNFDIGVPSIRPFLSAGVGATSIKDRDHRDRASVSLPVGGGVKMFLTDNIAARFDSRWVVNTSGNYDLNEGYFTGGLSYIYGGSNDDAAAVKQKPKDEAKKPFDDEAKALERDKKVTIDLLIHFDFDKNNIKPEYHQRIMEVAQFLKDHPDTVAEIEGHTDSVGTAKYNNKLSDRRADVVKNFLIKQGGVSASRLTSNGYGFDRPVASNKTKEGRAQNRRTLATIKIVVK